jgi:hypothetical protein
MKYDFIKVTFTSDEWAEVGKDVNGEEFGSFQRLLIKIKRGTNAARTCEISPVDAIRCRTFARYCPGGYETRYKAIVAAMDRVLDIRA